MALATVAVAAACSNTSAPSADGASAGPDSGESLCDAGSRLIESRLANDQERPFLLAAPPGGGRGRPLVIALHGSGGTPAELEAATHLAARGSSRGVSVVLPTAADEIWHNFSLSDQPYLDAVIRDVLRRTCANPHALVLAGFSNGGDEAQTIGCAEASRWRAVVVVSSSTVPELCVRGGPPVTLLRVHGLDDRVSPFGGRTGADPRDPVLPATSRWAAYDGCRPRPIRSGPTRRWVDCSAGTSVVLVALPELGHTWPKTPDVTGMVLTLAHGRDPGSR